MTPLRQRMIDAMQTRGLAERTQQAYVAAVAGPARHYHCSPDQLDSQQVLRCGRCASGHLQLVYERAADRSALALVPPLVCRGPP